MINELIQIITCYETSGIPNATCATMTALQAGSLSRHDRILTSVFPFPSAHLSKGDSDVNKRRRTTNGAPWDLVSQWLKGDKIETNRRHSSVPFSDLNDALTYLFVDNNENKEVVSLRPLFMTLKF